ncbi:hypothetical protein BCR42DRAFT_408161 [Absidia repens]|uniref:Uncharacterized protein n=1 Tax=Absidia repens TaxID=90262 RepID=A0A1X2IT78_9FUNG|nr:hypothetical protein BCR42DRAFT_408161 [Absidia repens]
MGMSKSGVCVVCVRACVFMCWKKGECLCEEKATTEYFVLCLLCISKMSQDYYSVVMVGLVVMLIILGRD